MFYCLFLCFFPSKQPKGGLCIVQCLIRDRTLSFSARILFDGLVRLSFSLPSYASYFLYNKYSTVIPAVVKDRFTIVT